MRGMQPGRGRRVRSGALLALLGGLLLAGCRYPAPIHTYQYLTTYGRMTDQYDPLLSLVYVPRPTSLERYRTLCIGPVEVKGPYVEDADSAACFATYLRVSLSERLKRQGVFEWVLLDAAALEKPAVPGPALVLEGCVTRFDEGSGLLRFLSGLFWFLRSGATDFQLEGKLVEADSGRVVMEFVDRRRHFGNTPWGPNPDNFHRGFAMRVTVDETAECLSRFLCAGKTCLPPPRELLAQCPSEGGPTRTVQ